MTDLHLFSVFLIGLLGGVHCIGMCGGIVGAFSSAPARRVIPLAVAGGGSVTAGAASASGLLRVLSYNAGRLSSYAIAGAIAGGVAQAAATLSFMSTLQVAGYWLANLMLVALGLYLMDAWRGIARLEAVGNLLWRRLQPLLRHLLPVDSALKAFALGGLWGWVPCGMVYSVLLTAMMSGSAASGASVMLAFGAGTLPLLLTMGLLGNRLQHAARRRGVRMAAGLLVLGFGLLGMARATHGPDLGWLSALCATPSTALHMGHP